MTKKTGERTLAASVLLSSPGPLVVGIGLFLGRSTTQLADFIRRTAELAAIIVAWAVYRAVRRGGERGETERAARLEERANLAVGIAMCLSGAAMAAAALLPTEGQKGNVIPGLVIALLGVCVNGWFWLRYRGLNLAKPDSILAVQSRLYRAKFFVDACVSAALSVVAAAPASEAARYTDIIGSLVVAAYMLATGVSTIRRRRLK